jgi:hypothetical protein
MVAWHWGAAVWAADYHLSSRGDDNNPGTKEKPWKTIERVNRLQCRPGDRILFQAGERFAGNLVLKAISNGTPDQPIVVGVYGEGQARIEAGTGNGIVVRNIGGVVIRDLIISGSGRPKNSGTGVRIFQTTPGGKRLCHIRISNVEAAGFGRAGIFVGGLATDGSQGGFEDVRLEQCDAHDNVFYGILIGGPWDDDTSNTVVPGRQDAGLRPGYTNHKVYISHCRMWRNLGDPTYRRNHSGNGLLLADTDGALIERCQAWENGLLCTKSSGGPCGIWTAGSNKVTIQFCESSRNHTGPDTADGDGFDLDGGMTNSILQYNYSHDNDGYGILVCNYSGAPHPQRNNTVRFNISQNDGRKKQVNAAIAFWTDDPPVENTELYNNTVLMGPGADNVGTILRISPKVTARFRNNLFIATGGVRFVETAAGEGLRFENNAYWAQGNPILIKWAGTNYTSLESWRQGSEWETTLGKSVGFTVDPLMATVIPGLEPYDVLNVPTLLGFRLQEGSPLIEAGLDLSPLDHGPQDFFGNPLGLGRKLPIGACSSAVKDFSIPAGK